MRTPEDFHTTHFGTYAPLQGPPRKDCPGELEHFQELTCRSSPWAAWTIHEGAAICSDQGQREQRSRPPHSHPTAITWHRSYVTSGSCRLVTDWSPGSPWGMPGIASWTSVHYCVTRLYIWHLSQRCSHWRSQTTPSTQTHFTTGSASTVAGSSGSDRCLRWRLQRIGAIVNVPYTVPHACCIHMAPSSQTLC